MNENSGSDDVAANLVITKRHRAVKRSLCSKNITNLHNLLAADEKDSVVVRSMILTLQSGLTELKKYDSALQTNMEEEALLQDMEESESRIGAIQSAILKAQDYIDSIKSFKNLKITESKSSELFKPMPKKLPTFDGDILQFQNFLEIFESAVDNKNYAPVDKLEALFDCLKGQARKLISGYSLIGENYEIVLNLLKSDYGNNAKLVETLILKLDDLSPPRYNYSELQTFKAELHCYYESLSTRESIKECSSCSTILGTILARKLPREIKDKIPWDRVREKWTVKYVSELVNQAIFVLEASGEHLNKSASTPKADTKRETFIRPQFRNAHKPTTTLYAAETSNSNGSYPPPIRCRFCKEEHLPSDC